MPVEIFGRVLPYKYIVAMVYVVALFLDILDVTIVNVAIPELGRTFATENAEWIVLGYTHSLAVWIPVSGWLGFKRACRLRVTKGASWPSTVMRNNESVSHRTVWLALQSCQWGRFGLHQRATSSEVNTSATCKPSLPSNLGAQFGTSTSYG